jgi:hypothetical protein
VRALGNFKPDRLLGFALQQRCPFFSLSGRHDIDDFDPHKVIAAQFAIDGHNEQSQIAIVFGQFQPDKDRPDMFGLQRPFLTNDATFFSSRAKCANGR